MKQRSVMVLSTLLDPSLLIADEITSALDVSTQRAVSETLVEFRDREFVKSMIVITHDISLLYQVADTILVMYAGRLAEQGPADTIVNEPLHPYTRLLIGSLPEVGVRHDEKKLVGHPRPPAVPPRPARRAAASGTAARSPSPSAPSSRRSSRSSPATASPAGRRRRRLMLELDHVTKRYHVGTFGGERAHRRARRELHDRARRDRLADRRERERQEHDRPDDPAPHGRDVGRDPVRREGRLAPRGAGG